MTDSFAHKLQALVEASTKGPWLSDVYDDGPAVICTGDDVILDAAQTDYPEEEHANAALIVTLVNAAPAILELLEAARGLANTADGLRIEEFGIRELIGNTNWEVLRHWIDTTRAALSALEASNG